MRERKTEDEWIVQGNYGYGWEDLTAEASEREGRERLHEYQDNEKHAQHRLIKRRVKKDAAE